MKQKNTTHKYFRNSQSGYTALELITTLGLAAVLSVIAVNTLKTLHDPVKGASSGLKGYVKQVRARAISTTSAYEVKPVSNNQIQSSFGSTCDSITTVDSHLTLTLPTGASFAATDWSFCFNSRGFPDMNTQITLTGSSGNRTVEVFLGGAVKELTPSGAS